MSSLAENSCFITSNILIPPGRVPTPPVAFPSRVMEHDRKLLEAPAGTTSVGVTIDAVVALDGNGMHAPEHQRGDRGHDGGGGGGGRKVIHVKAGRYDESMSISSKQKNVMLMSDGKGKTVIVGHKSATDGQQLYHLCHHWYVLYADI